MCYEVTSNVEDVREDHTVMRIQVRSATGHFNTHVSLLYCVLSSSSAAKTFGFLLLLL